MLMFLNRNGLDCEKQRAVLRGGNWNNGANAGPFCANLNNAPSNVNNNIGFRCCNSLQARFIVSEMLFISEHPKIPQRNFLVFKEMMNSARRTTSIQIQAAKPNTKLKNQRLVKG